MAEFTANMGRYLLVVVLVFNNIANQLRTWLAKLDTAHTKRWCSLCRLPLRWC